jgi:signal transduction histidine kinase
MTRLRWAAILVPAVLVVTVEALSDLVLDQALPFPVDTLFVGLVVLLAGLVMSAIAFRLVERLERQLRDRNAELEARAATARTLHAMTVAITAVTDLQEVLAATARNARTLLGAEVGWLILGTSDGGERLAAASGADDAFDATGSQPGDDVRRFVRAGRADAHLATPLQHGGATLGQLAVGTSEPRTYDVDDLETLSSLANQAAIAIENDRLQRELSSLAISRERERIAREMHDGLAQVLGYVNTKSQAVESLLEGGHVDDARTQMAELASAARSIYVDVREAILGLSTPIGTGDATEDGALAAALATYARRFGDVAKLAVSVETSAPRVGDHLGPEVVANLMRIVQEALTNVRKHALAHRVVVRLVGESDSVAITVEDDGQGFDPAAAPMPSDWPHFGQETIRQRAEAIGATASWDSAPGRGTRFRVVVPVA